MSALSNPKREHYAQLVADGVKPAVAFEEAGFTPNPGNARRMKQDEAVAARIAELQDRKFDRQQKRHDVTLDGLTERYDEALRKATADKAHAAVMAGINGLAKLHGLIVDKQRVENVDTMDEDQIAAERRRTESEIEELRAEKSRSGPSGTGATTH